MDHHPSSTTAAVPANHPPKRVARACDYCRRKRLKCTSAQHPCSNCQLYNANCVFTGTRSKRSNQSRRGRTSNVSRLRSGSPVTRDSRHNPSAGTMLSPAGSPASCAELAEAEVVNLGEGGTGEYARNSNSMDYSYLYRQLEMSDNLDFWSPELEFSGDLMFGTSQNHIPDLTNNTLIPPGSLGTYHASQGVQLSSPRAQAREIVPAQMLTPGSSRDGKVSGIESLAPKSVPAASQTRISPGLFVRKDAVNSNFIGSNSTGATIAMCLKDPMEGHTGNRDYDTLGLLIRAGAHVDGAGVHNLTDYSHLELPEKLFAEKSISSYFLNVHLIYPIVDASEFRRSWTKLYSSPRPQLTCFDYSRFYLIVAVGVLSEFHGPEESISIRQTCHTFYKTSWALLTDVLASPYADSVSIILLHVLYHLQIGKGGFAWVLCGNAIRIAQSIGLHRRSPQDFDITEAQIRLRSHLWWVAYSLDTFLSDTQGRPVAVVDSECDVEIFALPFEDYSDQSAPSPPIHVYYWHVTLSRIRNRFCAVLSRHETIMSRLNSLADLDSALLRWRDEIPMEYRPEQENLAPSELYHLVAFIHLEYHNLMRSIHWASVVSVLGNEGIGKSNPNPRIRASQSICLNAARSLVSILNSAAIESKSRKVTSTSSQIDYYLTALAVIYRNIFRSPSRFSSRADLEYFRAGKCYIERIIHSTAISPELVELIDKMLDSVEDFLNQFNA